MLSEPEIFAIIRDTQYEGLTQTARAIEAAVFAKLQAQSEPVALRYDFDGYGWQYLDSGSGSNWKERALVDKQFLYAAPVQIGINGLTEAETDASASVAGLTAPVQQEADLAKLKPGGMILKSDTGGVTFKWKYELEIERLEEQNKQLLEALKWALEWIDAVPKGTVLPTMPGFDRDYVDTLISKVGKQ